MITASLKNYRISPRKVRVVADLIRGKSVADARNILTSATKSAKHPLRDLLDSAVANASHNHKIEKEILFVKEIRVDNGYVLKRSQPMARGSAFPIKKRTSHVLITLAPIVEKPAKIAKQTKKSAEKTSVSKKQLTNN